MYKRVELCGNLELRKDSDGNAAIYCKGKLKAKGSQYLVGRQWLELKTSSNE